MKKLIFIMLAGLMIIMGACGAAGNTVSDEPSSAADKEEDTSEIMDKNYVKQEGIDVIYLAGGCFWGIEQLAQSIPGVVNAVSGYANGQEGAEPTYTSVSTGETGYRETVRVEYDSAKVSLDAILFAYFSVIDPTVKTYRDLILEHNIRRAYIMLTKLRSKLLKA